MSRTRFEKWLEVLYKVKIMGRVNRIEILGRYSIIISK